MTVLIYPAGVLAFAYLAYLRHPPSVPRSVLKTSSVAVLALAALSAGQPTLALALALSAIGDLALSRDGDAAFMTGVAAFALAHLAYVVLFLSHPSADYGRLLELPGAAAALALVCLGVVLAPRLARNAGALRLPVLVYIPVILSMGLAALTLPFLWPVALAIPAAGLFLASDTALAAETFLIDRDTALAAVLPFVVWPLYWGAQAGFLLAFTL